VFQAVHPFVLKSSCWLILFAININFSRIVCVINKSSHLSSGGKVGMQEVLLSKSSLCVTVACLLLVLAKGFLSLIKHMEGISI